MYNEESYLLVQQAPRRWTMARIVWLTIGFIVFLITIILLLLNGIVDTTSVPKDATIRVAKIDNSTVGNSSEISASSRFQLLIAGTYAVQVTLKNSSIHQNYTVTINNFFRSTKINYIERNQAESYMQAPISGTNFVSKTASWSYRNNGNVLFNDADPLSQPLDTCENVCFSMQAYKEGAVIGLEGNDNRTKVIATGRGVDSTPSPIDTAAYPAASELVVQRGGSAFVVYDGDKRLYSYSDSVSQPREIILPKKPAIGENGPLISVQSGVIAVVYGKDYAVPESGDGAMASSEAPSNFEVVMYKSTDGSAQKTASIQQHATIRSFAINPAGTKFTLSTQTTVESGSITEMSITNVWPEEAEQLAWINNDSFIYGTTKGIYEAEGTTAWPILASSAFAVSNFDVIEGNVYASIIFNNDSDQLSYPVIMTPSQKTTHNNLLSHVALKNDKNYSVQFNGKEFQLYIRTKDDGSKPSETELAPAYDYMKKTAPDIKIVVFE